MDISIISTTIFTAFSIGLLGSTHCIGMCGGISAALSLSLENQKRTKAQTIFLMLGFHFGRILSYTIAGFILGSIGFYLGKAFDGIQFYLRLVAGIMLILMGFYAANWWKALTYLEKIGSILWKKIQPISTSLMPVKNMRSSILLGSLWGWLPCGMVYSTLVWSVSQGTLFYSGMLMAFFGLGTLPSVFLTGLFARYLNQFLQATLTRSIAGISMILFGIWTIPGRHHEWFMSLFTQSQCHCS